MDEWPVLFSLGFPELTGMKLYASLRSIAVAVLLVSGALPITSKSGDWSGWRGPGAMAVSQSRNVPVVWEGDESLAWKTELNGAGGSSPIVLEERVYVTSYTGYAVPDEGPGDMSQLKRHLFCLNRSNGKLIWSRDVAAELPEQQKVRDHGYASSTPVADANGVIVFFGKSGVFAFSHAGEKLWRADVGAGIHGWGSATSPVLYKNLVIINASVESGSPGKCNCFASCMDDEERLQRVVTRLSRRLPLLGA